MPKFVLILLLSSFLLFWRLGDTHLSNWDEAWYADVSRTIAEKGNVLTPTWNGQPFLEKPPLHYWLTAISYRIFGDSEFSARFISAVAGIGTTLLAYKFGGLSSALILLSTPAFLWRARTGNLDSLLTFLIFLSAVYPSGAASGLAFLTKGFIGFFYPLFYHRRSLILGSIIAGVWFLVSYVVNGQVFLQQFFAQQGEKIGSIRFSLDYIIHLKTGLKLWFIIFFPAMYFVRKKLKNFVLFVCLFLLFLSFLQEKSTWFLMPVYPFIALIVGRWIPKRYLLAVLIIAIFQIIYFRSEYFVPDVAADEARVSIASQQLTKEDDIIYLTHYYYPTAVYYSRRKTYAVYAENPSVTWWILPKSSWGEILGGSRIFINTTRDDLKELERQFPTIRFETLFSSGDKLLVKKV
ncbi:hypothetical protein A3A79_04735 [Candidatus Gottesmanbacteria bacterium RIFCSPLOWO2_01_FULL_43_11b]|uniref:Glycosyltransferase RgtA/B/C/D-like domain-containing protein n=1 Tax=Candidatus Gottesmanbacteria bacterium RIFCSPLOWO2_01_FULL_43_11b TaxID=1798392 RepID=A0A1F6AIE0_9BACT|nr:MAG: hypothetical protein A3A79_04735 [Candidatus Gottesmanbacteria bacterium RIFCSPLOWO2_01_FULL_43_11b]